MGRRGRRALLTGGSKRRLCGAGETVMSERKRREEKPKEELTEIALLHLHLGQLHVRFDMIRLTLQHLV